MNNSTPVCAYCGQANSKLTRDHVIPQALWGGRGHLPSNVVVVPACRGCQDKWDSQAEYFRNALIAMTDKGTHSVANRVLEEKVVPSLERNRKAVDAFFRNPRVLPRKSPDGILLGDSLAFEIDWERFITVPEKIVRGLFFYKSQMPLPSSHVVRVFPGNDFWTDESFQRLSTTMETSAGCGDDVFQVRCVRDTSDPFSTAWVLSFYQQNGFFIWTEPANEILG